MIDRGEPVSYKSTYVEQFVRPKERAQEQQQTLQPPKKIPLKSPGPQTLPHQRCGYCGSYGCGCPQQIVSPASIASPRLNHCRYCGGNAPRVTRLLASPMYAVECSCGCRGPYSGSEAMAAIEWNAYN